MADVFDYEAKTRSEPNNNKMDAYARSRVIADLFKSEKGSSDGQVDQKGSAYDREVLGIE